MRELLSESVRESVWKCVINYLIMKKSKCMAVEICMASMH